MKFPVKVDIALKLTDVLFLVVSIDKRAIHSVTTLEVVFFQFAHA